MAANCIRTLLLSSDKTPADQSIARQLLPSLIVFLTETGPEDPERARSLIAQTLTSFVGTLPDGRRAAAMALIVPTLLSRAQGEADTEEAYHEISGRLLELAAADPAAFRGTVSSLTAQQRSTLEHILKAGQGPKQEIGGGGEKEEPSIKLSMTFG